jgi:hypothetical protein
MFVKNVDIIMIEIKKRDKDQETMVVFYQRDKDDNWKPYLTIDNKPLHEMKKLLVAMCSLDGEIYND